MSLLKVHSSLVLGADRRIEEQRRKDRREAHLYVNVEVSARIVTFLVSHGDSYKC